MKRILKVGVGCIVFLLLGFSEVRAGEMETSPFFYQQDFEGENDPVKCGVKRCEYAVNFKGLTTEKVFSGKKSFKLDITFIKGGSVSWNLPLPFIPVDNKLEFSGQILLGEETTGKVTLGAQVLFPPTRHTGQIHFPKWTSRYSSTLGEWKLIEGDIVKNGRIAANGVMRIWVQGAKGDNVGIYLKRIVLRIYGKPGTRVVVYVDNIKIEGEIPTKEAYKEEIKRRWAPFKKKFNEKISSWEMTLEKMKKELNGFFNLSPAAENMKREALLNIGSVKKKINAARKKRYMKPSETKEIDNLFHYIKRDISYLQEENIV